MANPVRKIAEVQESAWTQASGKIIVGVLIFVVAAALIYAAKFALPSGTLRVVQVLLGLVALGGLGLVGASIYSALEVRKTRGASYACPYCEKDNRFEGEPTTSFDCEFCNRTVHFENGLPVPVRMVTCPFCHSDHRVATTVQRYMCDRCNRPLELAPQNRGGPSAPVAVEPEAKLLYDVLLLATDRRHEIEIAMKLQNILVVNLPEARRLMTTASTTTPLIVSHSLPQRKAEAIRRQLQDVGATASLRPSAGSAPVPPV